MNILSYASAQEMNDPELSLATKSIELIQKLIPGTDAELERLSTLWNQKCGSDTLEKACFIQECDADPIHCKKGNILLFRGEKQKYTISTTSALFRTKLENSDYTKNLSLHDLLKKFVKDLGILRTFNFAPRLQPVLLTQLPDSGKHHWVWEKSKLPVKPNIPKIPARSSAITTYGFHVEASPLYYQDETLQKEVAIDPLISTSTNPATAKIFAESSEGRIIVLSVPKNELIPLCNPKTTLKPGTVIDPLSCTEPLNDYSAEQELDIVLYPQPEWIYGTFNP
jgi:hypothetical protein